MIDLSAILQLDLSCLMTSRILLGTVRSLPFRSRKLALPPSCAKPGKGLYLKRPYSTAKWLEGISYAIYIMMVACR